MHKRRFLSKMALAGDSQKSLAEHLGMSEHTMSDKVNGKSHWRCDEIQKIARRWKLNLREVHDIFFVEEDEDDET